MVQRVRANSTVPEGEWGSIVTRLVGIASVQRMGIPYTQHTPSIAFNHPCLCHNDLRSAVGAVISAATARTALS